MVSSIRSYCFCLFQAKDTISRYDEARSGLAVAEQDAAEIEKRSTEAGEALVRAGSEITSLHSQITQLETKRKQQEQLVKNINKVHKEYRFLYEDKLLRMSARNMYLRIYDFQILLVILVNLLSFRSCQWFLLRKKTLNILQVLRTVEAKTH